VRVRCHKHAICRQMTAMALACRHAQFAVASVQMAAARWPCWPADKQMLANQFLHFSDQLGSLTSKGDRGSRKVSNPKAGSQAQSLNTAMMPIWSASRPRAAAASPPRPNAKP
jgi:hypothetical protein